MPTEGWVVHQDASATGWLVDLEPSDASAEERALRCRRAELEHRWWAATEPQRRSLDAQIETVNDEIRRRSHPRIGDLIPGGYEAYAKILHPGEVDEDLAGCSLSLSQCQELPRIFGLSTLALESRHWCVCRRGPKRWRRLWWSELATRYGLQLVAELNHESWHCVFPDGQPVWLLFPTEGDLEPDLLVVLVDHLDDHTGLQEACHFYYWVLKTTDYAADHVFEGPLASVLTEPARWSMRGSPSAWWARSRTWCVVSDFDLVFTVVAGPRALIDALLDDARLETVEVEPDTRIDRWADQINRS